jgi:hypothetical protein
MQKSRKYLVFITIIVAVSIAGIVFFRFKNRIIRTNLPAAHSYNEAAALQMKNSVAATPSSNIPDEVNLQIPFTSQAPHQNWSLPYQQFCEEASTLMAASYIHNQPISDANDADAKLLAIKDFEMKRFGYYEDTNAEETATILREYFGLDKVRLISDPTVQDIKNSLAEGKVVIVPLAGRQLNNPYFQHPGPLYHMVVIKGYMKNGDFITDDPGTRRGADYIYKPDIIMNTLHDWNGGNVDTGKKVILVVG